MATPQPSLLLWGRISNDRLTLEPAFVVTTRPSLPREAGPYTLEGLDADAMSVFSISFSGEKVADASDGARHFAFAIPLSWAPLDRLATLRLVGNGLQATMTSAADQLLLQLGDAAPAVTEPAASLQRISASSDRLTWNHRIYPVVMVRDRGTGEIISFARGGVASIWTSGRELQLVFSDGIRSVTKRVSRH